MRLRGATAHRRPCTSETTARAVKETTAAQHRPTTQVRAATRVRRGKNLHGGETYGRHPSAEIAHITLRAVHVVARRARVSETQGKI